MVPIKLFTITFPDKEPALGLTIYPFKAQILRQAVNEQRVLDCNVVTASLLTSQVQRGDLIIQVNGKPLVDHRRAVTYGNHEDALHQMLMFAIAHAAKPRTLMFMRPTGPPAVIDQYIASLSQDLLFRVTMEQELCMFETIAEKNARQERGEDNQPLIWTQDQPFTPLHSISNGSTDTIGHSIHTSIPLPPTVVPFHQLGGYPVPTPHPSSYSSSLSSNYHTSSSSFSSSSSSSSDLMMEEEEAEISAMVEAQLRLVEKELRQTDEEARHATQLRWQQEEAAIQLARERMAKEAAKRTAQAERELKLKLVVETARAQRIAMVAKQRVDDEQHRAAERKIHTEQRATRISTEVKKRVDTEVLRFQEAKEALSRLHQSLQDNYHHHRTTTSSTATATLTLPTTSPSSSSSSSSSSLLPSKGWEATMVAGNSRSPFTAISSIESRKKRIEEAVKKRIVEHQTQQDVSYDCTFFDPRPVVSIETCASPAAIRTLRISPNHEVYPSTDHESIGFPSSVSVSDTRWKGEALQRVLAHKAQQKQRQQQQSQPQQTPAQQRIDANNNYHYNHNHNNDSNGNSNNKQSSNSWTTLRTLNISGP